MINAFKIFTCFQSPSQLNSRYQNATGKRLGEADGGFAYDAVWAIALALKRTEEHLRRLTPPLFINNFTYVNADIMEHFNRSLKEINFEGVTVSIKICSVIFVKRNSLNHSTKAKWL